MQLVTEDRHRDAGDTAQRRDRGEQGRGGFSQTLGRRTDADAGAALSGNWHGNVAKGKG